MRLYVDFRLEEEHADNWFLQADSLIDEISLRSHRDEIPRLYGVHLLILRGQNAEAQKELGRIAVRYAGSDADHQPEQEDLRLRQHLSMCQRILFQQLR
jgi:hypothetical protein